MSDEENRYEGRSLAELAEYQQNVGNQLKKVREEQARLQKEWDHLRKVVIPAKMEELGSESVRLSGIGTVSLRTDAYCNVRAGMQEQLQQWLIEQGYEDLIKPTVNPSTLKAQIKTWFEHGEEIPEEYVNFQPYTYAAVLSGSN